MIFATYINKGQESAGVLTLDRQDIMPLASVPGIFFQGSLLDFIMRCSPDDLELIKRALQDTDNLEKFCVPLGEVNLLAPIPQPRRNIICLGLNYHAHIQESQSVTRDEKLQTPEHPVYFGKMANRITGPGEDIFSHPAITGEIDYEVELAVIIGREGSNIPPQAAEDYIFGYSIFNDVTARDVQRRHKQWIKGKSLDGFSVLGPWLVHKTRMPFPVQLNIRSKINGELRQDSNTRHMIFDIPSIISDLSRGFTLLPGDIIATGTPAGVGMGFDPPRYLKAGDTMEMEIEKIGILKNALV